MMQNSFINGYTLLHKIGEGGMAEVWLAQNEIGKQAAIKILRKDLSLNEDIVVRFKNEAKVMVALNHTNIRQVYDFGLIEGRPCIIMEYLEGNDLSARLKKGERFGSEKIIDWWNQIVDALNYTHKKEIVHRDIKPSNIFLTDDGKIKLLDYGIAKIKGGITNTQTGTRMGTLMYMSPEQVKDSKYVDYRTDIYSLAVTFFHILSGIAPYDNTNSSDWEIQSKIVLEPLNLSKLSHGWKIFLEQYLNKDFQLRPELSAFSSPSHPEPQPESQSQPQPSPDTKIYSPQPPAPKPLTTPAQKSGSKKALYWLLAVAAVVIFVLVVNFVNNQNDQKKLVEQQRIELAKRKSQEEQHRAEQEKEKKAEQEKLEKERNEKEMQNRQARTISQFDQNAWNTAKNTNSRASYEKYLEDFPQGKYDADARTRLNELDRAAALPAKGKPRIEWVNIPAGTFTMGSPTNEKGREKNETQHQVTLSAFKMSKYEVTFEQYDAFCAATGRSKPSDESWGRGKRPVINVSWHDAKAFADWMDCRLPTEAEWEYAARAGTDTPFNTGSCLSTAQANYDGNNPYSACRKGEDRLKTIAVGSFTPNTWGLYDMHGNVREWCNDWQAAYSSGAQTNPKGPSSGSNRIFRGGGWVSGAGNCRSAYRNYDSPDFRNFGLGFRLVSPV